jgi:hypothetical protein
MALPPGERINKIQAIGAKLRDSSVADIDLTLDTFGVPGVYFDGDHTATGPKYRYVLSRLAEAQDAAVTGLHAHFFSGTPTPDEPTVDPPAEGEPLVFISHTWTNKALAAEIRDTFAELGIKGFVAHEDIEPTKDWATEIERNLHSCSTLVAVLTEDFGGSAFCNQEVGYALGRGRLVIGVMQARQPPPGLAGKYQAIAGSDGSWKPGRKIALDVLDVLFEHPMTRPLVIASVALRYANSISFDDARANWERLQKIRASEWAPEIVEIVETGGRENGQLSEGYASDPSSGVGRPIPDLVREHLDRLLNREAADFSDFATASGSEDDIPF